MALIKSCLASTATVNNDIFSLVLYSGTPKYYTWVNGTLTTSSAGSLNDSASCGDFKMTYMGSGSYKIENTGASDITVIYADKDGQNELTISPGTPVTKNYGTDDAPVIVKF